MKINIQNKEKIVFIRVSGVIDTETSIEFHKKIQEIDFNDAEKIILDFEHLDYITSAGLREILIIQKKASDKAKVHIVNANEDIMGVFEMTGFSDIINISGTTEENKTNFLNYSFKDLLSYKSVERKDKVIFIDSENEYTWEDVEKCAQIAAMDLYKIGVRKGSHVAICSGNSVNWMITFFAIQKLGAISLLLNYGLKENELFDICLIGDADFFCYDNSLTVSDYESFLNGLKSNKDLSIKDTYFIGKEKLYKKRCSEYDEIKCFFDEKVIADSPAVIVFSSGSTGKPKGVILSAYNIINAALNQSKRIFVTEQDKTCMILPLFHIFGLLVGVFCPILVNGSVYFPINPRTDSILKAISGEKCTIFNSVPTMMLALVNNKNFCSDKVLGLRSCTLAGAPVSEAQIYMLQEKFPNTHFTCAYGLSEIAPATSTFYDDDIKNIATTVGVPVNGVELKIDSADKPNVDGEILIKGVNLMTGYYKMPIEDQAFDEDGWLHTGDIGNIDENGYLRISGRIKDIIIRGGENIIPNEISCAISQNDIISDVKVVGVPDDFFGEIVVAAIVVKGGKTFNEAQMNEFLSGKLAKHKIPVFYSVYDEFPTLSNGKVDALRIKKEMTEKVKNNKGRT